MLHSLTGAITDHWGSADSGEGATGAPPLPSPYKKKEIEGRKYMYVHQEGSAAKKLYQLVMKYFPVSEQCIYIYNVPCESKCNLILK